MNRKPGFMEERRQKLEVEQRQQELVNMLQEKGAKMREAIKDNDNAVIQKLWKEYSDLNIELRMINPSIVVTPDEQALMTQARALTLLHNREREHEPAFSPDEITDNLKTEADELNQSSQEINKD